MNRKSLSIFTALAAAGALGACDTDETTTCSTDADCAGYVCEMAAGATEGVCSATECAAGYVADDTGACVMETCTSDDDCAPYACDTDAGACFSECTDGSECAAGDFQCDDTATPGQCVAVTPEPFMYVAVVSKATGDTALNNPNPGPDLDAISVEAGGNEDFAEVVEVFAQGAEGDETNTRPLSTHADAVLAKDTVDAGGTCDLDAQPGYVAIGDNTGFIAVSFGRELADGDTITVYEIDSVYCSDAATERPDAYEVYVSRTAPAGTTLADITSSWCFVGASGGNGGVFTQVFDSTTCD